MKIFFNFIHFKKLYIFFTFLSLINFFFSTVKLEASAFNIKNIEISKPFEINFDKNEIIDEGFKKGFDELISLITTSSDRKKIDKIRINQIKGMIESFSVKEEKFVNQIYYVNLGVSFNRKKIFNYLENKNIFPSIPKKTKFLFIPIIIDEKKKDLLIFSNNEFFDKWNGTQKRNHLIEYILPTEDLEDIKLIKSKYEFIESYDFKEIVNKYFLNDSIITLFFKNEDEVRVLSRINFNDKETLMNQSFLNIDINNDQKLSSIINELKIIYEDYWKTFNRINTSIKLPIMIKVNNSENLKLLKLEKNLKEIDLIYDYSVYKFNKDHTFYEIIFNGSPDIFLKTMGEKKFNFDTQNKIWSLQ